MKKQKPELITLAELSRRAGVTSAAVNQFMRKQEARGSPVPTVPGISRREKLVDLNHPLIRGYLQNQTAQPGNRGGGRPPGPAALAKLKAQTEKTELAASVLRGRYLDRGSVLRYLDRLLETEQKELEALTGRILKRIAAEFGPVSGARTREIRRILEQPYRDALEVTGREIERFRRETEPWITEAKPAARKHGKNHPLPR
jgi:hypothetical protein